MLKDILLKWNGVQVDPLDVYKDIFKIGKGYIQKENEPKGNFKTNPIAYFKNDDEEHGHFRIMFEDKFEEIYRNELVNADFCVMNGLTYFGAKYLSARASKMYAMIFDIDGVTESGLNNFFYAAFNEQFHYYPLPNYVALSGHGIHLYYVFDEPIELYPYLKFQLKEFKYALTERIWNKNVTVETRVQRQGINQPFRILGGKTKKDAPVKRVEVYQFDRAPITIEELNQYTPSETKVDLKKAFKESKMSLEEAKEKYPEWYARRVNGGVRGHWTAKRDLYDWWIKQIKDENNGATYGHRYFCVMTLAIYAVKSGIPYEKLKEDALKLIPFLNGLNEEEPFTENDVQSALECYDLRYCTFPIKDIVKITAISIQKNKRNYRKQSDHVKMMNFIRDELNQNKTWNKVGNGRKQKKEVVQNWRRSHLNGKKADCIRDTGLDKKTVYKWWNG